MWGRDVCEVVFSPVLSSCLQTPVPRVTRNLNPENRPSRPPYRALSSGGAFSEFLPTRVSASPRCVTTPSSSPTPLVGAVLFPGYGAQARGLAILWRSSERSRARRWETPPRRFPGRVRRVAWSPRSSGVGGSRPAEFRPDPRRPRRARRRTSPAPRPRPSRPPARQAAAQASTRARLDGFLSRRHLGSLRRLRPRRARRRPHPPAVQQTPGDTD